MSLWKYFGGYTCLIQQSVDNLDQSFALMRWVDTIPVFQGAYRDDTGKPVVLNAVRAAEEKICGSHFMEWETVENESHYCGENLLVQSVSSLLRIDR